MTRRAGFTLPELMVATVLLAVGMLSVATLMASGHRQHRLAVSRAGLATLAEAKIDELRSYGYASRESFPAMSRTAAIAEANSLRTTNLSVGGSLTSNSAGYFDVVVAPNGKQYNRRWQISNDVAPLNVRRLTVRLVALSPGPYDVKQADYTTLLWFQELYN